MSNDYRSKFVTPETAAKAVRSGDWVDYGFGAGFPELMDRALAARKEELKDVKVRGGLVIRPRIEVVESDPEQSAFTYYSWHIGDYERKLQSRGLCQFIPMILRSLPELYRRHIRVDVAFVPVSCPDDSGYCGLGISNYAWRTIFEHARTVIFEINEHLPRLQGVNGSHRVHLSEADYIVEGEHEPLPVRTYREPSDTDIAIARHVVEEIPDGAVLSLSESAGFRLQLQTFWQSLTDGIWAAIQGPSAMLFWPSTGQESSPTGKRKLTPAFPPGIWPWVLRSSTAGWTRSLSFSALLMWIMSTHRSGSAG